MTIQETIQNYKKNHLQYWEAEKYKWIAVKHFQDHWNIDAEDFAGMIVEALSQSANLLNGAMYYPRGMICALAEFNPEKMRELFRLLYNEKISLADRIKPFRSGCEELLTAFRESSPENAKAKNHYQDLRAICAYLSFKYPEKYFLYKARMYSNYKKLVDFKETSTETSSEIRKYENFARMCQAVLAEIQSDAELAKMQKAQLETETDCYADPKLHLLTQTIIYVSSEPNYGDSGESGDLKGKGVGDDGIPAVRYWLYAPGRGAEMWERFYRDGVMALGWNEMGDLNDFNSKAEIAQRMSELYGGESSHSNDALTLWQFYNEIQPGDIIFVKRGRKDILGMGTVESEYQYDEDGGEYPHFRRVNWTDKGHWKKENAFAMKTLTDVTKYTDFVESTVAKIVEDRPEPEPVKPKSLTILPDNDPYAPEDFLNDVYMDEHSYETLVSLIRTKKNVILQGAPGVGKTYAAKRLAYSMMGEKDADRVMMVQFHQSYSYEDFIMGFRPSEKGFELKHGAFYTFCKKAEEDSDNEYFFIIDEINRGNLSKIFGELFMLIESDKRNIELRLLYANEKFSVPANVYIIGMMNTADRSLAMLDYALRRRFAFFEMKPGFETDGFRTYRMGLHSERFDRLIQCVENLNNVIAADESLGEGFCIGHSYFCNLKEADEQTLSNIVEFELIPLLKEYWFDEPTKVKDWTNNLRSAIK